MNPPAQKNTIYTNTQRTRVRARETDEITQKKGQPAGGGATRPKTLLATDPPPRPPKREKVPASKLASEQDGRRVSALLPNPPPGEFLIKVEQRGGRHGRVAVVCASPIRSTLGLLFVAIARPALWRILRILSEAVVSCLCRPQ